MDFKIEKNIPAPAINRTKYPFGEMEIGDSFVGSEKASKDAAQYAFRRKDTGIKFASRKQPDGQYRIWRIA